MRPLGSTVFELLIVVALTTLAEPLLTRSRYPGCVIAVLVLTPVFLVVSNVTTGLAAAARPAHPFTHLIVAAAGQRVRGGRRGSARDRPEAASRAATARPLVEVTT